MSAKDRELEYILKLKDEATAAWNKFVGGVSKGSGDLEKTVSNIGTLVGGMFTLSAAKEFIQKANDAELQTAKLEQALKNQGIMSKETEAAMLDYSAALMSVTTTDDDVITGLQAIALTMTGNLNAVKPLTKAALDLAAAIPGMNPEQAIKMFSKTVEGQEGLKKLGISIGDTSNENERLLKTIDAVEKKFGGFAENEAKTGAGALKQLSNAVGNLEESLGGVLKDILIPIMPALQAVIGLIQKAVPIIISGMKGAFAELYAVILSPLALIEKGLNMLNVTQSKYFQGLEASAQKLSDKYGSEFAAGFSTATASVTQSTAAANIHSTAVKTMKERLTELKAELEKLNPGTAAYARKLEEITRIEAQFELAQERAKNAVKGLSGVTSDDTFFVTQFQKKLSALNSDITETAKSVDKDLKKSFGQNFSPTDFKAIEEQADIEAQIREKSFASEKDRELSIVDDWEARAVEMAHGNEADITAIRQIAADERAQIEIDAAVKTFEQVAQFAQRGISIISKFTQQGYQAEIQSLEKAKDKELKAIDAEREATKNKYEELLENENLTAAEKDKLKKQAEDEDKKILARKSALEDQYNQRIADQKRQAFDAEKRASMIEAIVNTAVEVTKVLATPWMIPIVAGLGAAEVALIASQPTPQFHGGGAGYLDAPPSKEAYIKIRGQEDFRVWTPEQAAERDKEAQRSSGVTVVVNINSPFTPFETVRSAVMDGVKRSGLTVDKLFAKTNGSVVLAQ